MEVNKNLKKSVLICSLIFFSGLNFGRADCNLRDLDTECSFIQKKCEPCPFAPFSEVTVSKSVEKNLNAAGVRASNSVIRSNAVFFLIGQHLHQYLDYLYLGSLWLKSEDRELLIQQGQEILDGCFLSRKTDSHQADIEIFGKLSEPIAEQKEIFREFVGGLSSRPEEDQLRLRNIVLTAYVAGARRLHSLRTRLSSCDGGLFREYAKEVNETSSFLVSAKLLLGSVERRRRKAKCPNFRSDFGEALNILQRFPSLVSADRTQSQPFEQIVQARGIQVEKMALRYLESSHLLKKSLSLLAQEITRICSHPDEAASATLKDTRLWQALMVGEEQRYIQDHCIISCMARQNRISVGRFLNALGPGSRFDSKIPSLLGHAFSGEELRAVIRSNFSEHLESTDRCVSELDRRLGENQLSDQYADFMSSKRVERVLVSSPRMAIRRDFEQALGNIKKLYEEEQIQVLKNLLQLNSRLFLGLVRKMASTVDPSEIAILAFQENIKTVFSTIAKRKKIPIVIREPTLPSQAGQQNNLSTKGMVTKNKSSVFFDVTGRIPCDPEVGKIGDRLRAACKNGESCDGRVLEYLRMKLREEKTLIDQQLAMRDVEGKPLFYCIPITRMKGDVKEMVTFVRTGSEITGTVWVPYVEPFPVNVALVLADVDKVMITADTDPLLIGQPRGKGAHIVMYDDTRGYRTRFSDYLEKEINLEWKQRTGNTNTLIQHGDEANFGLTDFREVIIAFNHVGEMDRFDLRPSNPDFKLELRRYARWLLSESAFADIVVPTEEIQRERAAALREHGMVLDYAEAKADYAVIREVLGSRRAIVAPVLLKPKLRPSLR